MLTNDDFFTSFQQLVDAVDSTIAGLEEANPPSDTPEHTLLLNLRAVKAQYERAKKRAEATNDGQG